MSRDAASSSSLTASAAFAARSMSSRRAAWALGSRSSSRSLTALSSRSDAHGAASSSALCTSPAWRCSPTQPTSSPGVAASSRAAATSAVVAFAVRSASSRIAMAPRWFAIAEAARCKVVAEPSRRRTHAAAPRAPPVLALAGSHSSDPSAFTKRRVTDCGGAQLARLPPAAYTSWHCWRRRAAAAFSTRAISAMRGALSMLPPWPPRTVKMTSRFERRSDCCSTPGPRWTSAAERAPQSAQSEPTAHEKYSAPNPPSSQSSSFA